MRLQGMAVLMGCLIGMSFIPSALAYDAVKCQNANAKAVSAQQNLRRAKSAHDNCVRYGDTTGTGLGRTNCQQVLADLEEAHKAFQEAVNTQWRYCY